MLLKWNMMVLLVNQALNFFVICQHTFWLSSKIHISSMYNLYAWYYNINQ